MEQKIKAAVAAWRSRGLFLVARTDAREPEGLDAALSRAERYLKAGADAIYIEAPKSEKNSGRLVNVPRRAADDQHVRGR